MSGWTVTRGRSSRYSLDRRLSGRCEDEKDVALLGTEPGPYSTKPLAIRTVSSRLYNNTALDYIYHCAINQSNCSFSRGCALSPLQPQGSITALISTSRSAKAYGTASSPLLRKWSRRGTFYLPPEGRLVDTCTSGTKAVVVIVASKVPGKYGKCTSLSSCYSKSPIRKQSNGIFCEHLTRFERMFLI
jgi:hypothetical protein